MRFDFNFYSSLLLIFFVHGIIYSVLLYRKSKSNGSSADRWLSVFLILCVLYISPWMLGFAGWYDNQPYRDIIFYTPLQHLYLIGPVIFFYVQSVLNPSFRFSKKQYIHLLPGILYLIYSATIFITDKLVLHRYFFLSDGQDRDFDHWYQITGFISMLIYFFISIRYFTLYQKLMTQAVSYAEVLLFRWMKNFLYAFLIMLIIRLLAYTASFFPIFAQMKYVGAWWQYFSFALIFYYIAITGYSNSTKTKVPFRLNLLSYKPSLLLHSPYVAGEENSLIEDAEVIEIEDVQSEKKEDAGLVTEWKPRIEELFESQKIYNDPELSLTQVARLLETNPSIISKVINQGFQLNFNDFINRYRIEAVKEKLQADEHKIQTLLGIAYDCGFNSKTTFNRAFKKATGMSPKYYILSLQ